MGLNFLFGPLNPGLPFPIPQLTTDIIGPFQNQKTELSKFTQEVRLASPSSDAFEWMAGLYYTHEEGTIDQFIGAVNYATGQPLGVPLLDDLAALRLDSDYKELAGFANVTWHVTDRFDITGGGRFAKNDQKANQASEGNPFVVGTNEFTTKSDESVFTYAISPRFDLSDTTAVYARISKGYRPGGPNVVSPLAPPSVPRTFDSDSLTSYEVGLKTDLGRQLSFDIAAYHLSWKDIQLITNIDNVNVNINGGSAASNGIEGSLQWRPVTGLRLGVNAAWIDAHLTSDTPFLVGGFDGDTLPWVPKFSFSLNSDYEWKLSDTATAFVGGTLAYTGKQRDNFVFLGAAPQQKIPDYAVIDLRAGVEFGHFTVDAYVKNLTNTEGVGSLADITDQVLGTNLFPGDAVRASLTRPRTIGFSLTAGF
jgi:outer membrane receptor protein involved in Fe transport